MKILIFIIAAVVLLVVVALFVLGQMSQSGQAKGLVEAKLAKCPGTPNCVCSEYPAAVDHYLEPLVFSAQETAQMLPRLKAIIRKMGGVIVTENTDYLATTFTSSVFRFVDDLEIRIDRDQNQVHLRSASRVGRGDGGVNRKRIEQLKNIFNSKTD